MIRATVGRRSLRRARSIVVASTAALALVPATGTAQPSAPVTAPSASVAPNGLLWLAGANVHSVRHDRRIGHKVG